LAAQGFAAQGFAAQGLAAQGFAAQGFAAHGFAAHGLQGLAAWTALVAPKATDAQTKQATTILGNKVLAGAI
jgi:hypothetical protein